MSRQSRRRRELRGGGSGPAVSGEVIDRRQAMQEQMPRVMRTGEQIQLGDLDDDAPTPDPVTATFRLKDAQGEVRTFRVNPDLTELTVVDLLEEADSVSPNDPKSMTITKKYAFEHVHPEDRAAFWKVIRGRRLSTPDVMRLCWRILDGVTANPTGGRSDSSAGQPGTSTSSQPGSSTPDAGQSGRLYDLDDRRAAFQRQIARIQARTDENGKLMPINAAIAAQLAVAAESQGIDLTSSPSASASA